MNRIFLKFFIPFFIKDAKNHRNRINRYFNYTNICFFKADIFSYPETYDDIKGRTKVGIPVFHPVVGA